MADFRIGTCSWKYGEWKGLVYSNEKGINFLEEYSRVFDTVEIDQWFWSLHRGNIVKLPDTRTADEYATSVPEDFLFTIKAPNSITLTHPYARGAAAPGEANPNFLSVELFERFLDKLTALRPRIASIMLQFEYLNKQKMPDRQAFFEYLDTFLAQCGNTVPIGIETRNPNYLCREYFDVLDRHQAHHVYLQGYYMPAVTEVYRQYGCSARKAVLRLHGPDRKAMEEKSGGKWDRLLVHRDDELRDLAIMTTELLICNVDVIVNVNNHYEGAAPLTIRRFRELLAGIAQEAGVSLPSRGGSNDA
jgi:uncharacterized protein YecE (DUF72 family)